MENMFKSATEAFTSYVMTTTRYGIEFNQKMMQEQINFIKTVASNVPALDKLFNSDK